MEGEQRPFTEIRQNAIGLANMVASKSGHTSHIPRKADVSSPCYHSGNGFTYEWHHVQQSIKGATSAKTGHFA